MIGIFAVFVSRLGVVVIQVTFLTWMTDLAIEYPELGIDVSTISSLWQKQVLLT